MNSPKNKAGTHRLLFTLEGRKLPVQINKLSDELVFISDSIVCAFPEDVFGDIYASVLFHVSSLNRLQSLQYWIVGIHRSLAILWYKSGACTLYNSRDTAAFLVSFQEMVQT